MDSAAKSSETRLLLFLDGDSQVGESLIESHMAEHASASDNRAVMGSARLLAPEPHGLLDWLVDSTDLRFPYERHEACPIPIEWPRFRIPNSSMTRDAFLSSGGFLPGLVSHAQDMGLAARLERSGVSLLHNAALEVKRLRPSDIDVMRAEVVAAYTELVDVVAQQDWMLSNACVAWVLQEGQDILVQAEHQSRGDGSNWTILAKAFAGAAPERLRQAGEFELHVRQSFSHVMSSLMEMWKRIGILRGLRKHGVRTMAELRDRSGAGAPWPLATDKSRRYVCWPDFGSDGDLEALMRWLPQVSADDACLVVRYDSTTDIDRDTAIARLERSYERFGEGLDVELLLLDDQIAEEEMPRLHLASTAFVPLPSSHGGLRGQFMSELALPRLHQRVGARL
jgi:hypothetical protein